APQAARNLNICAVIMDNGVYGLTKGQSSPTTVEDTVTSSTPYGKLESTLNPLDLYLTLGVTYIASGYSTKPRDLAGLIKRGMEHDGFSIVHVNSPCTTYNDTYALLKGNKAKGIDPLAWEIPNDHDSGSKAAARDIIEQGGVPLGVVYQDPSRPSLDQRLAGVRERVTARTPEALLNTFAV
ncbi:MAG: thiamine pyrophosphate-dependent enzyme, partial [Chloroflexi bacterium]|nr:thiamine pyrophosphate-dependent enzyme [Chloroflexota bacterium]